MRADRLAILRQLAENRVQSRVEARFSKRRVSTKNRRTGVFVAHCSRCLLAVADFDKNACPRCGLDPVVVAV